MQVILLERIDRLGKIGDEVRVKNGFARNFLIPQGKALIANDKNRKRFEIERDAIEARNAAARDAAQTEADNLEGAIFVLIRQAGETGQLYGSVTARDVAEAAEAAGYKVDRAAVRLDKPIKAVGLSEVSVRLHAEVSVKVQVNVARSTEEAERQEKGEDIVAALQAENQAQADEQAGELAAAAAERGDMGGDEE
ncbi:ribosomal protein L9 [Hyphomonas neptunium ATCC 15444]|uniref:Large ribosomal subunit protein bL9 n=2 Tax=Hyphomonas TaxID=85 RepID=RL9_HYPNA|nr:MULTISPECIES: 50S ribosomal protein L9 [Hyphomonas]Q0C083.1 RecName: Full=Large ribosomal subunit protein bL9; AltName: Full=50S ribosomal protein L9 [Hyphomonas neptunium ATCC 15444]ABI76962.1 ribosomal protein L9 [Hyphomonas neptunium ATCC 15444]KCZ90559.1 50S ribosomal protein L9 [Hyphomonas hirschiana VP5]